jgi:hypothetical protein
MAEKVKLQKTVKEKDDLKKVISSTFTTFVQPEDLPDTDTVSELFRLYDKLYLEIPLVGPLSHTYLIEESSKLVDIQQDNQAIQPLLDEITDLRERLLLANEQIFELEQELAGGSN